MRNDINDNVWCTFFFCNKNVIVNRMRVNAEEKVEFIEKQTEEMTCIGKIKI